MPLLLIWRKDRPRPLKGSISDAVNHRDTRARRFTEGKEGVEVCSAYTADERRRIDCHKGAKAQRGTKK